MVRYFFAWMPLVSVAAVAILIAPWLGVIALLVVLLAVASAVGAIAWAIVAPLYRLVRLALGSSIPRPDWRNAPHAVAVKSRSDERVELDVASAVPSGR